MSDSIYVQGTVLRFPGSRAVERDSRQTQYDAITSELQAARAREKVWLREKSDLLQRHDTLAQEFEHRLANSLQIIVSVLSLQSRTASPEAAAQLTAAASRVASFARVHRRLHVLDHQASVEFKPATVRRPFQASVGGGNRLHDHNRGCGARAEWLQMCRHPR